MPSSAAPTTAQPPSPPPLHTPGPWRVGREVKSEKRLVYISIEHDGAESSLANTVVYPHRRDGSTFATETRREHGEDRPAPHVSDEECRANACLIAAAPEMLTALVRSEWCIAVRGVGNCCPNCGGEEIDGHRAGCALGAAIRKATVGA